MNPLNIRNKNNKKIKNTKLKRAEKSALLKRAEYCQCYNKELKRAEIQTNNFKFNQNANHLQNQLWLRSHYQRTKSRISSFLANIDEKGKINEEIENKNNVLLSPIDLDLISNNSSNLLLKKIVPINPKVTSKEATALSTNGINKYIELIPSLS
ncbi:hypothetical protein H8356DRAFT_1425500 [Neocallimastix lanati (nom. inval.)]|nr:hypothetical protein H8356DRAFT_1425500 [Neocallimastix sp. JGI-2020a]